MLRAEKGGAMAHERVEIGLRASPGAVWALIGDFGGIGKWMPGIESCVVDGEDRILKTMGIEITERLERRDEEERTLTYRIVGGAPVANHEATIAVLGDGEGSRVTWDVEIEPDEMAPVFRDIYQQALTALQEQVGG
jgi:carbon monoxide dehydrogenase subunit G